MTSARNSASVHNLTYSDLTVVDSLRPKRLQAAVAGTCPTTTSDTDIEKQTNATDVVAVKRTTPLTSRLEPSLVDNHPSKILLNTNMQLCDADIDFKPELWSLSTLWISKSLANPLHLVTVHKIYPLPQTVACSPKNKLPASCYIFTTSSPAAAWCALHARPVSWISMQPDCRACESSTASIDAAGRHVRKHASKRCVKSL